MFKHLEPLPGDCIQFTWLIQSCCVWLEHKNIFLKAQSSLLCHLVKDGSLLLKSQFVEKSIFSPLHFQMCLFRAVECLYFSLVLSVLWRNQLMIPYSADALELSIGMCNSSGLKCVA